MKNIAFFIIILSFLGCSKEKQAQNTEKPQEKAEIRVEYGFDRDDFVVHNLMPFPLTEALVELHVYKGNVFHSHYLLEERITIPPDEWLYISKWSRLEKGETTENVEFTLPEGCRIRYFQLTCNEGEIDEDFKEPD